MNAELIESVVSSKTERDCPSDSNHGNGSGHKTNRYSREKRSIYSGLESPKQRLARLSKQRIRNRKNRAQKTEEETKSLDIRKLFLRTNLIIFTLKRPPSSMQEISVMIINYVR